MKTRAVKDLMIPISEYPTVSKDASLFETIKAFEEEKKKYGDSPYRHGSVIALDENNHVAGKVSPMDIFKALEPRYENIGERRGMARTGFSPQLLTLMQEEFELWASPLENLFEKAKHLKVTQFMLRPTAGEHVDVDDGMNVAMHRLVIGRYHSLLVTRGKEIVGVLRSSDVFDELCQMIDEMGL